MADASHGNMSESGDNMEESDYGSTTEDDDSISGRASFSSNTSATSNLKNDKSPLSQARTVAVASGVEVRESRSTSDPHSMSTSASEDEGTQQGPASRDNQIDVNKNEGPSLSFRKSMEMECVWIQHIEGLQARCDQLQNEKKALKEKLDSFGVPEQQEEKLNNMTQKIVALRKEKEELAVKMEEEEEYLINELNRKLQTLQQEKEKFERNMEKEHHDRVLELQQRIIGLEKETANKQSFVHQLRKEKVDLENQLEQEQERLLNHLRRRILKLEEEKRELMRLLRNRSSSSGSTSSGYTTPLDEGLTLSSVSMDLAVDGQAGHAPGQAGGQAGQAGQAGQVPGQASPHTTSCLLSASPTIDKKSRKMQQPPDKKSKVGHDDPGLIHDLQVEVKKLRSMLAANEIASADKLSLLMKEERHLRAENVRLQRKLQVESQKRLEFCRTLSESESSLEMEDERHFNEMSSHGVQMRGRTASSPVTNLPRSSPIPLTGPNTRRPVSPGQQGLARSVDSGGSRCVACGSFLPVVAHPSTLHHVLATTTTTTTTSTTSTTSTSNIIRPSNIWVDEDGQKRMATSQK